jgi:nucleotide-binding universal stress UspA family protein
MRVDTIVIGIDFSPTSATMAKWVATTLAPHASIVFAHAIDHPAKPAFLAADTLPDEALASDARREAEARLSDLAPTIRSSGYRIEVGIGRAHEIIERVATEVGAELIAVSPHGNHEHESLFLGSTADSLVRSAPVPVLVGPRTPRSRVERVLAAVEDAPVMPRVLEWADGIARQLSARLTVLHALDVAAYSHVMSMAAAHARGDVDSEQAQIRGEMEWQTQRWLRESVASGLDPSRFETLVEHGSAAEVILQTARRERAGVIVMGRHGTMRGVPALLGRTVRRVLHAARCGVLVIPPP